MADLKVVEKLENGFDIPAAMRRVADQVEVGECGAVQFVTAIMIGEADDVGHRTIHTYCWGRATDLEVAGALAVAVHRMVE